MTEAFPSTTFLLIRHAQARSKSGQYGPDTPLSSLGLRQAKLVANVMKAAHDIKALYSSPLPRAKNTALQIGESLNLEVMTANALAEMEIDAAPLNTIIDARTDLVPWKANQRCSPDGETIGQFFRRVGSFCDRLCDLHRDARIAVVTHAGTIDAIFRWAMGISARQPWAFETEVGNASISEIKVWPRGRAKHGPPRYAILYRIGDDRHLSKSGSRI